MRTIFALASGRSGTHFLYQIMKRNVLDCVARHETYGYNPSMFGRPIYDHLTGDHQHLRRLLERKKRVIERITRHFYVETSHAFLKSYYDVSTEYFPSMQLVHLIRNPLSVAKSLANREAMIRRYRIPFCHYRGADGEKYFRWALTRREPIYRSFDLARLNLFQICVLEWIEIENRAAWFLDHFNKRADCVSLRVPEEINDEAKLLGMFEKFGLHPRQLPLDLAGRTNRTPGIPTEITPEDRMDFEEVVRALPATYLEPFRKEPYIRCSWAGIFGT